MAKRRWRENQDYRGGESRERPQSNRGYYSEQVAGPGRRYGRGSVEYDRDYDDPQGVFDDYYGTSLRGQDDRWRGPRYEEWPNRPNESRGEREWARDEDERERRSGESREDRYYGGDFGPRDFGEERGSAGAPAGRERYSSGRSGYGSGWGVGRGMGRGSYGGSSWESRGSYASGAFGSAASNREFGGFGGWSRERGQFYGHGPKGYARSDERIREDICERLTYDDDIDAREIDVRVHNGEVTLEGEVEDRHMKRRAEDIAEEVNGVKDVHNRLHAKKGLLRSMMERVEKVTEAGERRPKTYS